uniref:Uncharacterized protein n=1 Tax=Timema monikensis TaxID=170555 RepID=A0A7R9HUF9_9NEOP|nr:unnamed protein product [Timema monikensis]
MNQTRGWFQMCVINPFDHIRKELISPPTNFTALPAFLPFPQQSKYCILRCFHFSTQLPSAKPEGPTATHLGRHSARLSPLSGRHPSTTRSTGSRHLWYLLRDLLALARGPCSLLFHSLLPILVSPLITGMDLLIAYCRVDVSSFALSLTLSPVSTGSVYSAHVIPHPFPSFISIRHPPRGNVEYDQIVINNCNVINHPPSFNHGHSTSAAQRDVDSMPIDEFLDGSAPSTRSSCIVPSISSDRNPTMPYGMRARSIAVLAALGLWVTRLLVVETILVCVQMEQCVIRTLNV